MNVLLSFLILAFSSILCLRSTECSVNKNKKHLGDGRDTSTRLYVTPGGLSKEKFSENKQFFFFSKQPFTSKMSFKIPLGTTLFPPQTRLELEKVATSLHIQFKVPLKETKHFKERTIPSIFKAQSEKQIPPIFQTQPNLQKMKKSSSVSGILSRLPLKKRAKLQTKTMSPFFQHRSEAKELLNDKK